MAADVENHRLAFSRIIFGPLQTALRRIGTARESASAVAMPIRSVSLRVIKCVIVFL